MKALLWLVAGALLLWMGVPVQVLVGAYLLLHLAVFALGLSVGKAERQQAAPAPVAHRDLPSDAPRRLAQPRLVRSATGQPSARVYVDDAALSDVLAQLR